MKMCCNNLLVGMKGLEPSRLAALVPKTSVSTNSTTSPELTQGHFTRFYGKNEAWRRRRIFLRLFRNFLKAV